MRYTPMKPSITPDYAFERVPNSPHDSEIQKLCFKEVARHCLFQSRSCYERRCKYGRYQENDGTQQLWTEDFLYVIIFCSFPCHHSSSSSSASRRESWWCHCCCCEQKEGSFNETRLRVIRARRARQVHWRDSKSAHKFSQSHSHK